MYTAKTISAAENADDIALLANEPTQGETLLHSLERATAGIGLHVNANKTEYMYLNQTCVNSTLNGSTLKLVDKFTYLGSNDVLLWTPSQGRVKAGRPARTHIQQLCTNTRCSLEDLPKTMDDREEWREGVKNICADSATWWRRWWWYVGIRSQRCGIFASSSCHQPVVDVWSNQSYLQTQLSWCQKSTNHCCSLNQLFSELTFKSHNWQFRVNFRKSSDNHIWFYYYTPWHISRDDGAAANQIAANLHHLFRHH